MPIFTVDSGGIMWHLADPNPFLEAINSQQEAANRVLRHLTWWGNKNA